MATTEVTRSSGPSAAEPLPPEITRIQPGGGVCMQIELAWGRLRRWGLRTFRPGYVRRMAERRRGACPGCRHDVIDARDLKYYRNVCGYSFLPEDDRFAWRGRLPLARAGLAELLILTTVLGTATVLTWVWAPSRAWALVPFVPLVLIVSFFRNPRRVIPGDAGLIVSPADGKVVDVAAVDEPEFVGGRALKIGIFLSVFNVHVNRAPAAARVIRLQYVRGKFFSALRACSAAANEQVWISLEEPEPPYRRYLVKQIAGQFARRIVCELRPGQVLGRGEPIGMIKLGSRTEVLMPWEPDLEVLVTVGDAVKAGSSRLAQYVGDTVRAGKPPANGTEEP